MLKKCDVDLVLFSHESTPNFMWQGTESDCFHTSSSCFVFHLTRFTSISLCLYSSNPNFSLNFLTVSLCFTYNFLDVWCERGKELSFVDHEILQIFHTFPPNISCEVLCPWEMACSNPAPIDLNVKFLTRKRWVCSNRTGKSQNNFADITQNLILVLDY